MPIRFLSATVILDQKRLDLLFFACVSLTLAAPVLAPRLRLFFLAPFLVTALYQKPLVSCIHLSLLTGLLMDLFSSDAHLGLYASSYCIAMFIVYSQKRNFFADSLSTLPVMTFLFSFFSSLTLCLLLYNVELINIFSWRWIGIDLLLMSAADALYAFGLFILPALILGKPRRKGEDYFLDNS